MSLAQIIHNPKRKRGTGNKIPRLRVGLRKKIFGDTAFFRGNGNRGDTPLLHSSCRMAEAKLTTKAVKSQPARVDTAREATLSVPASNILTDCADL